MIYNIYNLPLTKKYYLFFVGVVVAKSSYDFCVNISITQAILDFLVVAFSWGVFCNLQRDNLVQPKSNILSADFCSQIISFFFLLFECDLKGDLINKVGK